MSRSRQNRANRFDADGNYLLPSERPQYAEVQGGEDDDGLVQVYREDEIEQMARIRRQFAGSVDDLELKAKLKSEQQSQQQQQAPSANIAPATFGINGTIGNQSVDLLAGQTSQLAQWTAEADRESATIGVYVAPILPLQPLAIVAPAMLRPYGILTLGSRSITTKVKFDIGNGVSFNVGAAFVMLLVGLEPLDSVNYPALTQSGPPIKISGWLSSLPLPKTQPPTLTTYIDALGNGADSGILPRPAFAVSVLPIQMSSATGTCKIEFIDIGRHVVSQITVSSPGAQVAPIPWPNDAIGFRVTNLDVGAQTIRVVHALAL
jgi:hypothetical protein